MDVTEPQARVLDLVARGLTDAEIAGLLCVSHGAVRSRLECVYDRTGARTRAHAAALWVQSGRRPEQMPSTL